MEFTAPKDYMNSTEPRMVIQKEADVFEGTCKFKTIDEKYDNMLYCWYIGSGCRIPTTKELKCLCCLVNAPEEALMDFFKKLAVRNMVADPYSPIDMSVLHKSQRIECEEDETFELPGEQATYDQGRSIAKHIERKLPPQLRRKYGTQVAMHTSAQAETRKSSARNPGPTALPQVGAETTTMKIRNLIDKAILKAGKGCSTVKKNENNKGELQCIDRCGRRFTDFYNWRRHILTSQPQDFWFCRLCGNIEHPNAKFLFMRKDKFVKHLKGVHADKDLGEAFTACKIVYNAPYKKRCGFCDRNRFIATSFDQRNKHIRDHFKKGATMEFWTEWDENDDPQDENYDSEDENDDPEDENDNPEEDGFDQNGFHSFDDNNDHHHGNNSDDDSDDDNDEDNDDSIGRSTGSRGPLESYLSFNPDRYQAYPHLCLKSEPLDSGWSSRNILTLDEREIEGYTSRHFLRLIFPKLAQVADNINHVTDQLRLERLNNPPFRILETIGEGGFSRVYKIVTASDFTSLKSTSLLKDDKVKSSSMVHCIIRY
jgi:hypothetical protein